MIWAWLVGKIGKVAATVIAAVVLLLVAAAPFYFTYHAGWNARDAQAKAAEQAVKVQVLQQLLEFGSKVNGIVGDYVLRRGGTEIVYRTLTQEIQHVVTVYKPTPQSAPVPLPRCVFTRGYVGLWNDALAGDVRSAAGTAGADGGSAGAYSAGAEDLLDAGITQQDILENHVANAKVDRDVRNQCEAAIAYIKALPRKAR